MAVHVAPVTPAEDLRAQVMEVMGTPVHHRGRVAGMTVALQPAMVDGFVEMVRLRTEVAERDARIAVLTEGLRTWRDRAGRAEAMRRIEATEARDREREIISLLHQQMQVADSATAELERIHALPWWRRLRT